MRGLKFSLSVLALPFLYILSGLGFRFLRKPKTKPIPGPPPDLIPFVGNARQIRNFGKPWWIWAGTHLKSFYGDVVQFSIFGKRVVVLNSFQANADLLSKEIYTDRPQSVMACDIMGGSKGTVLAPYGSTWRMHRRLWHQSIGAKAALSNYYQLIQTENRAMVLRLLHDDNAGLDEVRLCVVRILLGITYGLEVDNLRDPLVQATENAARHLIDAMGPGRYLVDTFPILRFIPEWLPGAGWKRFGRSIGEVVQRVAKEPFDDAKRIVIEGQAPKSCVSDMLASSLGNEDVQRWVAASVYGGGTDTTSSAIAQFIGLMLRYPEVQKRIQEELDTVHGQNRIPNYQDKDSFPYVWATMREVLRWELVQHGVPHRLMEEDEYRGFLIPKGTTVLSNIWAMSQDPEEYQVPSEFDPERHLTKDKPLDPFTYLFGLGRRGCPGRALAEMMLFDAVVTLLATTSIERPIDDQGNEYFPDLKLGRFATSDTFYPKFPFRLLPRSKSSISLLRSSKTM